MSILSCSAPDCDKPVHVKKRQLCLPHYNRFMAYGDLNLSQAPAVCRECGQPLAHRAKTGPPAEYCSYDCKRVAAYKRRIETGGYERDRARQKALFEPKPVTERPCGACDGMFNAKRADAKFCSTRCSTRFRRLNPDGSCSTDGCPRTSEARGLCAACWKREGRAAGRIAADPWSERRKANYQKRRALKMQLPADDIRPADVYERDEWVCGLCSEPVEHTLSWPDPMSPSLDHVLPLSKGGHHVMENVQLAHLSCNVRKGARTEEPTTIST